MPYDLNQLTEALRTKAEGQGQMAALNPQVASAQALQAAPDNYENPWAALGGVLDRSRGNREMAALQPLLAKARGRVAGGENASTLYDAQRRAEQTTYDRSRNAAGDLIQADQTAYERQAPARALTKATQDYERKSGELKNRPMTNLYTGEEATVGADREGNLYIDGSPVSGDEWVDRKTGSAAKAGSGSAELDAEVDMFPSLVEGFKDDYANPAWGLPFAGEVRNAIAREAPIASTEGAEEAQKWWSDFDKLYSLPTRHEMFGSALTATEKSAWRNATANPNMNPQQIREQLNTLLNIKRRVADRGYVNPESGLGGGGAPAAAGGGYPVPAGISELHWTDLSPDEQREYLEMKGEL